MAKAAASKKKLTPEEAKLKRQANDPIFLAKQREKLAAAAAKQATATGNAAIYKRCLFWKAMLCCSSNMHSSLLDSCCCPAQASVRSRLQCEHLRLGTCDSCNLHRPALLFRCACLHHNHPLG